MSTSTRSQIAATVFVFFGVACFFVFDMPFIASVVFAALCVMWSAWVFISIFRGTDEPLAAGVRYALAAGEAGSAFPSPSHLS